MVQDLITKIDMLLVELSLSQQLQHVERKDVAAVMDGQIHVGVTEIFMADHCNVWGRALMTPQDKHIEPMDFVDSKTQPHNSQAHSLAIV